MSPKTLIALALLVGGLIAFIWFVERDIPSSDERAELAQRLFRLEAHQVQSITLEWSENSVHLERAKVTATTDDGVESSEDPDLSPDWRLIHPFNAEGDQASIDQFVESLITLEKKRSLQDVDPASLGLESPRAVVRIKTTEGDRVLRVGSEVPASSTMIVQIEGDEEYQVVPNMIWSSISKEPGDWRSKELFKGSREAIERVSVQSGGRRLILAKRADEFWIEAPIVDRADEDKVSSLLTAIVGLKVEEFVDDPDLGTDAMALDPPAAALEVVLAGELSPLRLDLGGSSAADEESYYARVGTQIVKIKSDLTADLNRAADEWREHSLASMKAYEIDRVSIADGDSVLSLERADANWKRGDEEIEYASVSDFLHAATGLEAERVLGEDEDRQFDREAVVFSVTLSGSDSEETLSFYPADPEGILAKVSNRDALLIVGADALDELRMKLTEVRAASPVESRQDAALEDEDSPAAATS
jgi:hypothetical protein